MVSETNDTSELGVLPWIHLAIKLEKPFKTVRSEWSRKRWTSIRFADSPWESFEELEQTLNNIDGVSSVQYEDPYQGTYRSPRYHLRIDNSADTSDIVDAIEAYYDGLDVRASNVGVTVIVSATS